MTFYPCQDKDQSSASWLSVQANIVNWLLDPAKGGLGDTFSTQEVNRAIGLLQTNAINMEKLYNGQIVSCKVGWQLCFCSDIFLPLQALYPTFSFISHSCVANCRVLFRLDNAIKVMAQVLTKRQWDNSVDSYVYPREIFKLEKKFQSSISLIFSPTLSGGMRLRCWDSFCIYSLLRQNLRRAGCLSVDVSDVWTGASLGPTWGKYSKQESMLIWCLTFLMLPLLLEAFNFSNQSHFTGI